MYLLVATLRSGGVIPLWMTVDPRDNRWSPDLIRMKAAEFGLPVPDVNDILGTATIGPLGPLDALAPGRWALKKFVPVKSFSPGPPKRQYLILARCENDDAPLGVTTETDPEKFNYTPEKIVAQVGDSADLSPDDVLHVDLVPLDDVDDDWLRVQDFTDDGSVTVEYDHPDGGRRRLTIHDDCTVVMDENSPWSLPGLVALNRATAEWLEKRRESQAE